MPPQTVNAYYSAAANEIVLPAAILQPPLFDLGADDAVNYGALGALMGHEVGHAFDDRGRRFDGSARCATGGPTPMPPPMASAPRSSSRR